MEFGAENWNKGKQEAAAGWPERVEQRAISLQQQKSIKIAFENSERVCVHI